MYILLFIFSLIFAFQTSSLYNNFTYLSYSNHKIYYIIWIITISLFLLYKVFYLFKKITFLNKLDFILISSCFVLMLIGSLLPYNPNNNDLFSTLHIGLSMLSSLQLLVIIKILINRSCFLDFNFYKKIDAYYNKSIFFLITFIIMFGSINIIIELFFLAITFLFLYLLENKFVKK